MIEHIYVSRPDKRHYVTSIGEFRSAVSETYNGVTFTNCKNGSYYLNGTSTAGGNVNILQNVSITSGHVYCIIVDTIDSAVGYVHFSTTVSSTTKWYGNSTFTATATATNTLRIYLYNGVTISMTISPRIFDLTEMYGSGNEPSAAAFEMMYPMNNQDAANIDNSFESDQLYTYPTHFDLLEPDQLGLAITKIEGLDSVEAEMDEIELAGVDGTIAGHRRLPSREIEITIVPYSAGYPYYDPQQLRYAISKIFPVKKSVKLDIESPLRKCWTEGVVMYNEFTVWGDDPNVVVHITCPDPYLYGEWKTTKSITSLSGSDFQFAFSNESLTENLITFGEQCTTATSDTPDYYGDIDNGMIITLVLSAASGDIAIFNEYSGEGLQLSNSVVTSITGSAFKSDDIITIDTRGGSKGVYLRRVETAASTTLNESSDGITYWNILGAVERGTVWPQLTPGENNLGVTGSSLTSDDGIKMAVKFNEAYEGV